MAEKTLPPRMDIEDVPIVPPPSTFTVDYQRKPVLFTPEGKALVRLIGFR